MLPLKGRCMKAIRIWICSKMTQDLCGSLKKCIGNNFYSPEMINFILQPINPKTFDQLSYGGLQNGNSVYSFIFSLLFTKL